MRYTYWDRTERATPRLLVGEDDRELATDTGQGLRQPDGGEWRVEASASTGVELTSPDNRTFSARGKLKASTDLPLVFGDRELTIVPEGSKDFVVEDPAGTKIAQFTSANHGVRRAIVEYSEGAEVTDAEAIVLGYIARSILEKKLTGMAIAFIATLVILSVAAILAFII